MAAADQPAWLTLLIDRSALRDNIALFRRGLDPQTRLLAVVKANAYGHGLLLAAGAFLEGGADLLGVHSLDEARGLREGGISCPILVLGPLTAAELESAAALDLEFTVASVEAVEQAARYAAGADRTLRLHLKVETGVNRQGVVEEELPAVLERLRSGGRLVLAGLSSHFADVEDTTDHAFARRQMERFEGYAERIAAAGFDDVARHMSCSASVLLWDRSQRDIARVGIAAYGIWPSTATQVSYRERGRPEVELRPAMTWQVRISQVRRVPAGETVGYGRTWQAPIDSRIAVLPVGYSDGWLRGFSGRAHVLVHGRRAPVVGRICMNLCMVDVTHIPDAVAGDPAVLLGTQGGETISAAQLAAHLGTIPYEIITLPGSTWQRVAIDGHTETADEV